MSIMDNGLSEKSIIVYNNDHPALISEEEKEKLFSSWLVDPKTEIFQNKKHFCFNSDTALLASFMNIHKGDRVLEIGTNNAALLVYADRFEPASLTGIEILEEPARLASWNLQRSANSPWKVICADIRKADLPSDGFDVILSNPPFFTMEESGYPKAQNLSLKKLGRIEANLNLEDLITESGRLLRSHGRFFMVHRPDRIMEILRLLDQNGFGLYRMGMAYDSRDRQAKSLLIEAIKDRKGKTIIEPEILLGISQPE